MSRLNTLDPDDLSEQQLSIYREILASRGGRIDGPFLPWLHSPILADRAQKLGAFCRFGTSLPARLSELAILFTARWWRADVEWHIHAPIAAEAGVSPTVIEALRAGEQPLFEQADEALLNEFTKELYEQRRVGDATYREAVALLGEQAVVELVGLLGYYALVAMTLNVFEVKTPDMTQSPFPADLKGH